MKWAPEKYQEAKSLWQLRRGDARLLRRKEVASQLKVTEAALIGLMDRNPQDFPRRSPGRWFKVGASGTWDSRVPTVAVLYDRR